MQLSQRNHFEARILMTDDHECWQFIASGETAQIAREKAFERVTPEAQGDVKVLAAWQWELSYKLTE